MSFFVTRALQVFAVHVDRQTIASPPLDRIRTSPPRQWGFFQIFCKYALVSDFHVGFIGLGDQGSPIAQRIASQGYALHVWARDPATLVRFSSNGATIEASPIALGAACAMVGICVVNDDDVREVVLHDGQGVLYGLGPGSVLAIHSTVAPQTVIDLARIAGERGVHVLDAPVSGGSRGARAATMTVMVGGEPTALEIARPIFATFASDIAHLGPVGSGQLMKLLNNNLCYANTTMAISALELAEQLGMDARVAASVLKVSSGASVGLSILTEESTLRKASGPTSNIAKDVGHFRHLLDDRGLADAPLASAAATTAAGSRRMPSERCREQARTRTVSRNERLAQCTGRVEYHRNNQRLGQ